MGPLVDAVRSLGASVDGDALPVTVRGPMRGGTVRLPGDVSSQFLSGLLLAGPHLAGGLRVELTTPLVSAPYVAMTAAVMRAFGVDVERDGEAWVVPEGRYRATTFAIEPDASAASYFFAAAVLTGGRVTVPGLGRGSLQGDLAFVDVLERMGAVVERGGDATTVAAGPHLTGVDADLSALSDTAQTLAAVAVFADSPTRVRGIGFIRRKETDRVAAVVRELRRCGVEAEETDDGFVVHPGAPRPAVVETYDDHRMAMSFALLGLRVAGIAIADPDCVAKTFPGFWDALEELRRG
jgi:3-phosphoshikimate 1-carboxyvinyltransferase